MWYYQGAGRVLYPTPHPKSLAGLNPLTWGCLEAVDSIWAHIAWLLAHHWFPALCFWANYLTLLLPDLYGGGAHRSTCLVGLL